MDQYISSHNIPNASWLYHYVSFNIAPNDKREFTRARED